MTVFDNVIKNKSFMICFISKPFYLINFMIKVTVRQRRSLISFDAHKVVYNGMFCSISREGENSVFTAFKFRLQQDQMSSAFLINLSLRYIYRYIYRKVRVPFFGLINITDMTDGV